MAWIGFDLPDAGDDRPIHHTTSHDVWCVGFGGDVGGEHRLRDAERPVRGGRRAAGDHRRHAEHPDEENQAQRRTHDPDDDDDPPQLRATPSFGEFGGEFSLGEMGGGAGDELPTHAEALRWACCQAAASGRHGLGFLAGQGGEVGRGFADGAGDAESAESSRLVGANPRRPVGASDAVAFEAPEGGVGESGGDVEELAATDRHDGHEEDHQQEPGPHTAGHAEEPVEAGDQQGEEDTHHDHECDDADEGGHPMPEEAASRTGEQTCVEGDGKEGDEEQGQALGDHQRESGDHEQGEGRSCDH